MFIFKIMTKKILLISLIAALILVAVPTLAKKDATTTLDPTCIKNAIETRDTAIIATVNRFQTTIVNALNIRKTALKAAWEKTDRNERRTATKEAWTAYKKAARDARQTLRTEKRAAWKKYSTDRKACGISGASDDNAGEGVDANI